MKLSATILSTGRFLPDKIVTNKDLTNFPEQLIPLIEAKTGVKSRRFVEDFQCTSDIGIIAAQNCLRKIDFDSEKLDAIILATSSPDRTQPATATRIQHKLGAPQAFAFDVNSVCTGGVYAVSIADSFIKAGFCKNVLIIAAEVYSKYLNPADFSTYPYFGDGAGAVLLAAETESNKGILASILRTDGSKADIIQVPAGGTMIPYSQLKNPQDIYFKMVGREVYDFAVTKGSDIVKEIVAKAGVGLDEIKCIIPHQANINIIRELAQRLNISMDKIFVNLEKYGNTAAASVLIALDEVIEQKRSTEGDSIVLAAFGGGLSWGAVLIKL